MMDGVGGQRRYQASVAGFEVPTGKRRHELDEAVQRIITHVAETGQAGIYTAAGDWRAPIDDPLLAPMLQGPDRVRRGERVDGKDTILAVFPQDTYADVQDRLYRARHYASPRMVTRARIADVLYAGIGAGIIERVPTARVEAMVDQILAQFASGELPRRLLAHHCRGLREYLGLPAGEWTDAADQAARRGREMCGAPARAAARPVYDENRWGL